MPTPSKKKTKHPQNSKKARTIQRQKQGVMRNTEAEPVNPTAPVTPAAVTAGIHEGAAPAAIKNTAVRQVDTMEYPFLAGELKRIGILAGIIIVVLIVLALIIG